MYKNRVKKWVGMIFLLAIYMLFNLDNDVFAANSCTKSETRDYYGVKYETHYNTDQSINNIEVKVSRGEFYIKVYSPEQGKGKTLKEIAADSSIHKINPHNPVKRGKKYTIENSQISRYIKSGRADFYVLVYTEGDSTKNEACAKKGYWFRFAVEIEEDAVSSGNVPSIYYNSSKICQKAVNLRNNVVNNNSEVVGFIERAMTPCFSPTVPYNISIDALNSIYNNLEDFVKSYNKNYNKITIKTDLPALDSSWVEVKNTNMNSTKQYKKYGSSKKEMLTCNTKNEITTNRFFHIKKESHQAIIKTNGTEKSVEACKTECREQVEVTYGPPKSVIAGQCFTYEVEIKSKVVCNTSINFDQFPKYEDYAPCILKAHCNNLNNYDEQAGPNEDFDQCVQNCDGGKYSQSCINSCYDQVYNKKKITNETTSPKKKINSDVNNIKIYAEDTLALSNLSSIKSKAKKVVNDSDTYGCPNVSSNVSATDIENVYKYVNANITGRYSTNGVAIKYTPKDGCEWNLYGYAYYRDKQITARTVCNHRGLNWQVGAETCSSLNQTQCLAEPSCYPGVKRSGARYVPSDGFKRSQTCREVCSWVNTGVDGNGRSCTYLDKADAESQYKSSIKNYISATVKCMNQATTCVDEGETATFVMSANTDIQTGADNQTCDSSYGSQKNCLSWKKTPVKNKLEDNREAIDKKTEQSNNIIKFMGGSCATEKSDWIYHTILTFPGAWINNKNGEISYNKQDERYYKHYSGNYCTPLNAKNVNANWWLWNQYIKSGKTNKTFEEWATTSQSKKLVYNIFSRIRKFGLYNWSMDVGCFYAIQNETIPPDTPNPDPNPPTPTDGAVPPGCKNSKCIPECSGKDCTSTDVDTSFDNFTSKSISTTTMFPSSKKTSTSSIDQKAVKKLSYTDKLSNTQKMAKSPKRSEGYNWNVEATNLSVKGYPVTPSSLVKKIEGTDDTYSAKELDYDITLTPQNISNIKKIKGDKSNYTYFGDGKYTSVENGYSSAYIKAGYTKENIPSYTYYKSKFIRNNTYVSKVTKSPEGKGLTCNNLKTSTSCDLTLGGYVTSDNELQSFIKR